MEPFKDARAASAARWDRFFNWRKSDVKQIWWSWGIIHSTVCLNVSSAHLSFLLFSVVVQPSNPPATVTAERHIELLPEIANTHVNSLKSSVSMDPSQQRRSEVSRQKVTQVSGSRCETARRQSSLKTSVVMDESSLNWKWIMPLLFTLSQGVNPGKLIYGRQCYKMSALYSTLQGG